MSNRIVVLKVRACSYGIGEDKCAIVWCDSSILSVRTFYGYVHPRPLGSLVSMSTYFFDST